MAEKAERAKESAHNRQQQHVPPAAGNAPVEISFELCSRTWGDGVGIFRLPHFPRPPWESQAESDHRGGLDVAVLRWRDLLPL